MQTRSFSRSGHLAIGFVLGLAAVPSVASTTCPPSGGLLLEVRRSSQVTELHPTVNTVSTVEGTFACKNGLGTTTATAVASVFAIAPDVSVARAVAPALTSALGAALAQHHVAGQTSCSLAAPEGTSEYLTLRWHGRGTRANTFSIAIGYPDLYPPCSADTQALLAAVRAYTAGLPLVPGAEVYTFPR